jgi:16S rRNA processing protein RimM
MTMKIEDSFYIGYITKTKGLKGELQLFFEYPEPQDLVLDTVFLEINGKLIPYFVTQIKLQPNQTANIYFEDVDVVEKAEKLVRKKAYLPNTKKPERNPDEFLITDLKGFLVIDETRGELGEIVEIHEYPQQFVAVVPHQFREILFPLNDEFILEIDEKKGILHVNLPEGLIDLYLNS